MNDEDFLQLIENNKVLLSKENTTITKKAKKRAWENIENELKGKNLSLTSEQLKKKWMNMKNRTLEKMRKRHATGGGPFISNTSTDERIIHLLGENNPKIVKVPGSCSSSSLNTRDNETPVDIEIDDKGNDSEERENGSDERGYAQYGSKVMTMQNIQMKGMFYDL